MQQKFITSIGVKSHDDSSNTFRNLKISKGSGILEITSKESDSGTLWTLKLSVKLIAYDPLFCMPCIIKVNLRDCYYIIGNTIRPAIPIIKEADLIEISVSYDSLVRPVATKKVLSFI